MREGTDRAASSSVLQKHSPLLVTLLMGLQGRIGLAGLVTEAALEGAHPNSALLVSLVMGLQAALLGELVPAQLARVRLLTSMHHRVRCQVLHCLELLVAPIAGQHLLVVVHLDVVPQLVVSFRIPGASTAFFASLRYKRALMPGQVSFQTV